MSRLNYVELPVSNVEASTAFFEQAFGWQLRRFSPGYAATITGLTDIGLQGDPREQASAPLPVIEVDDIEAVLADVKKAGGEIIRPIYTFPGGARFHAREPSGIEIAVWTSTSQWDGPEDDMFVGEKKPGYRAG